MPRKIELVKPNDPRRCIPRHEWKQAWRWARACLSRNVDVINETFENNPDFPQTHWSVALECADHHRRPFRAREERWSNWSDDIIFRRHLEENIVAYTPERLKQRGEYHRRYRVTRSAVLESGLHFRRARGYDRAQLLASCLRHIILNSQEKHPGSWLRKSFKVGDYQLVVVGIDLKSESLEPHYAENYFLVNLGLRKVGNPELVDIHKDPVFANDALKGEYSFADLMCDLGWGSENSIVAYKFMFSEIGRMLELILCAQVEYKFKIEMEALREQKSI